MISNNVAIKSFLRFIVIKMWKKNCTIRHQKYFKLNSYQNWNKIELIKYNLFAKLPISIERHYAIGLSKYKRSSIRVASKTHSCMYCSTETNRALADESNEFYYVIGRRSYPIDLASRRQASLFCWGAMTESITISTWCNATIFLTTRIFCIRILFLRKLISMLHALIVSQEF